MPLKEVPEEVQKLVGTAMKAEDLVMWWHTPHQHLRLMKPVELWNLNGEFRAELVNFINSALSGDMV